MTAYVVEIPDMFRDEVCGACNLSSEYTPVITSNRPKLSETHFDRRIEKRFNATRSEPLERTSEHRSELVLADVYATSRIFRDSR